MKVTLVESDKKMEREVVNVPVGLPRRGGPPIFTQTTVDVLFTRNAYDVTYVCAKCGHSWTERRVKVSKG